MQRSTATEATFDAVSTSCLSAIQWYGGQTIVTIQFDPLTLAIVENALVDGNYELTLNADQITRNGSADGSRTSFLVASKRMGSLVYMGTQTVSRSVNVIRFAGLSWRASSRSDGDSNYQFQLDFDANGIRQR